MSIGQNSSLGQIKPISTTPPGGYNYPVTPAAQQAHQSEFEDALNAPSNTASTDASPPKSGWSPVNQKEFNLSIFQMEHGKSMAHDQKMKEIWDGMNDLGKSNKHHH